MRYQDLYLGEPVRPIDVMVTTSNIGFWPPQPFGPNMISFGKIRYICAYCGRGTADLDASCKGCGAVDYKAAP